MARFRFRTPAGEERTVSAPDEATARTFLARQTTHPDPDTCEGDHWTPQQLDNARKRLADAATALTLIEDPR